MVITTAAATAAAVGGLHVVSECVIVLVSALGWVAGRPSDKAESQHTYKKLVIAYLGKVWWSRGQWP